MREMEVEIPVLGRGHKEPVEAREIPEVSLCREKASEKARASRQESGLVVQHARLMVRPFAMVMLTMS